jgi:hypothetical protein
VDAGGSFPLGEQAILKWTQGWPTALVVGLGLLGTTVVGLADCGVARLLGYDFVATGFYLVPIGFVAFVSGTRFGLLVADEAMCSVKHGSKNGFHHFLANVLPRPSPDATRRQAPGAGSSLRS